jgi:hypothetical protein
MAKGGGDLGAAVAKAKARRSAKAEVASGTTYSEREEKTKRLTEKQQIALDKKRIKAEQKRQKEEKDAFELSKRLAKRSNDIKKNSLKLELSMFGQLRTHGKQMIEGVIGPGGTPPSGYTPGTPGGGGGKKGKKGKDTTPKGLAAAAGMVLLAAALYKATQQSKIVSVMESSIAKALGLLIDLVLLPYLPLITWGIIQLYNSITDFGKQWGELDPTDPFNILLLPMLLANALTQPLADAIYNAFFKGWTEPFLLGMVEDYNNFVTEFNNFFRDGGELSHIIDEFVSGISTTVSDIMKGFVNYLLGLPVIGDILRAAGVGHQNLSIPDVTEAEYKGVYAERNKTEKPGLIPTVHTQVPADYYVEVLVKVEGKDTWVGGDAQRTFEERYNRMNWDQRAANWGTM